MNTAAKVVGLIFLASGLIYGLLSPKCGSGSRSVKLARSLSQDRLGELFQQMRESRLELIARGDERLKLVGYQRESIPKSFSDLNPKGVRPCDFTPNILLEGCYDEFVHLNFYGIGEDADVGDHSPRIQLQFANQQGTEVLWRGTQNEQSEQAVAPNRSLAPALKSSSPVRGSED